MRIVSLSPSASETLCFVGGASMLVGRSARCTFPPEIAGVPVVEPADEQWLANLNPDLILVGSEADASPARDAPDSNIALGHASASIPNPIPNPISNPISNPIPNPISQPISNPIPAPPPTFAPIAPSKPFALETPKSQLGEPTHQSQLGEPTHQSQLGEPTYHRGTVLRFPDPETVEGIVDACLTIGAAAGLHESAQNAAIALRGRLFRACECVNPYADGPSVAVLVSLDPLVIAGGWISQLVERAGGRHALNPTTAQPRAGSAVGPQQAQRDAPPPRPITAEELAASRPDLVVVGTSALRADSPGTSDLRADRSTYLARSLGRSRRTRREAEGGVGSGGMGNGGEGNGGEGNVRGLSFDEARGAVGDAPWLSLLKEGARVALVDGGNGGGHLCCPTPRIADDLCFLSGLINRRPELTPPDYACVML